MPSRWSRYIGLLVLWHLGAVLLGLWFGQILWWLVGALVLCLTHTLHNLYVLDGILDGSRRVPIFSTQGFWAEIFARIEKLRVKARNRKKKYHRVLREVRESTGALSDGGVILNADHEIVWFNPAATRLLGLDPKTDIGHRIDNLIRHPDFVDYLAEPHGDELTVPSPRSDREWLSVQMIPYGRDQRIAIIRDITQEMHLERTRRDFVANASHELRSPLTVISGYLDTLAEDDDLPEAWEQPVGEMLRQADRMTQILRDLIELTRLESAEDSAKRDLVDVAGMLEAMVKEAETRGERSTVTLSLETDAALLGNESELHSIFSNLLSNALRFTPAGGRIDLTWRIEDTDAVFEVSDTGIGIAEDQIPRITERFYRVDPGRSRATGGTGLGLAIVKHALQRHGGKLEVRSVEGQGSTFTCRFSAERVVFRGGTAAAAV